MPKPAPQVTRRRASAGDAGHRTASVPPPPGAGSAMRSIEPGTRRVRRAARRLRTREYFVALDDEPFESGVIMRVA